MALPLLTQAAQQRTFETVREQLALVLAAELDNQANLRGTGGVPDSDLLGINVYVERNFAFNTISENVAVNVQIDNLNSTDRTQINKTEKITFHIDVFVTSKQNSTDLGSHRAARRLHKICGVIDSVLSNNAYLHLGLPNHPFSTTMVENIDFAKTNKQQDAGFTQVARITYTVTTCENEIPEPGILLDGSTVKVTLHDSNQSYFYTSGNAGPLPPPDPQTTLTLNGNFFTNVEEFETTNIQLLDQNDNEITPTSTANKTIEVNLPEQQAYNLMPLITGQTQIFGDYDDGFYQDGRLTDWTTLEVPGPHGTTDRFTDELLGTDYTNGIIIDFASRDDISQTVVGWSRSMYFAGSWDATRVAANSIAIGSFTSGWRLANRRMYDSIMAFLPTYSSTVLNYPPFNITTNVNVWTSTTNPRVQTQAFAITLSQGTVSAQAKTVTSFRYMVCRLFTYAELGI